MNSPGAIAQAARPNQREADFLLRDYRFGSGETLPELRLHYTTLGTPDRKPPAISRTPCC